MTRNTSPMETDAAAQRRWTVLVAWLASLVVLAAVWVSWERGPAATRAECETIFERLVALELAEMGYRDPALVDIRRRELAKRFSEDLQACEGRTLPEGAMACIAAATSAEDLSHRCLH